MTAWLIGGAGKLRRLDPGREGSSFSIPLSLIFVDLGTVAGRL